MEKYGLLGEKLSHSYSPWIHGELCGYDYKLYEVEQGNLKSFFTDTDLAGINVTIPYKKKALEFCTQLSDIAEKVGCVNTIVREKDGWHGFNTDYYGFCYLVNSSGIEIRDKKTLVLGSGGASQTVCRVLEDMGASEIVIISRTGDDNYTNLHKHSNAQVIVNATPVGMYPQNGESPVDLKMFPKCEGVIDVIYNPSKTALLLQAEKMDIRSANGLSMLVAQAKRSAELFTGSHIEDSVIQRITGMLEKEMENIVLIGMPGCGKSSIGSRIAKKLGREFIDADTEIEKISGTDIPNIFKRGGEAEFRRIETDVLERLGKNSKCVIATGGGCVTREENYPLLHQNGRIVWIKRNIDKLPKNGRPLSMSNPLQELYKNRREKYLAFADFTVENNGPIEDTVEKILEIIS